jgi:hypothetical protein
MGRYTENAANKALGMGVAQDRTALISIDLFTLIINVRAGLIISVHRFYVLTAFERNDN